ncbi:ribosomal protection-like ABC-F family protein [Desemzia sp. FAM 23991]|uniref:ribosomal protection-like ABC-F family protein n=1 Tax=unclassified Desemzia TaxID=2685243 RepID=UPI00388AF4B0
MLIEVKQLEKSIGEKNLFTIPEWHVYEGDRIGIVGRNGSGKTTLLNVLAQKETPDTGSIQTNGTIGFIEQLPDREPLDTLSGGEHTKEQINRALSIQSGILFADEPTSHLDSNARQYLEKQLQQFMGAVLVISHDRAFLNRICNRIVEIEEGEVRFYTGNYQDYRKQKDQEKDLAQQEYEAYVKEKKRLKKVMTSTHQKSENVRRAPKRMGPSEARLHKMGGQGARKTLDKAVKNYEKRIEHLTVKEKPVDLPPVKIQLDKGREIHNPILISGSKVHKRFDSRVLFDNTDFQLLNHSQTALIGANGSGKTTLINMIFQAGKGIHLAKNIHFGYFSQALDLLDESETILENVMRKSTKEESFVRMLLARLLFKGAEVFKPVSVLSGGEKNKVSLALLLVSDANVLVLDEPTNYLDIASMEAIEEALMAYEGTILFVSHDEQFVKNVATHIWQIKDRKVLVSEVFAKEASALLPAKQREAGKEELLVLENRLNAVISKLSLLTGKESKDLLEKEYTELLQQIRLLKK